MNKLNKHLINKQSIKLRKALSNIRNCKKEYRFDKKHKDMSLPDFEENIKTGKLIYTTNNSRFFWAKNVLLSLSKSKQAYIYREIHSRDKFLIYDNRYGLYHDPMHGGMFVEKEAFEHFAILNDKGKKK